MFTLSKKTVLAGALILMLSSCTVVRFQHVGRQFPPSSTIEVVYAQRDLKGQKYEFIGEIMMEVHNSFITPEMEARLVEEARERGANAVIIGNLDVRYFSSDAVVYSGIGIVTNTTDQAGVRIVRGYLVRYQ